MIHHKKTAKKTAELLLQIKAITLQPKEPFTWASGWKSPIYCDNRTILSYPAIRTYIREEIAKTIEHKYGKPDIIAGVATGAIAIGMLVAQYLNIPFIYVRPEAKKHGRKNQIEGHLDKGKSIVVIEDLISTGNSGLKAVNALRESGANVKGMVAIFSYGFKTAQENFEYHNVELTTLSDYEHMLEVANEKQYISDLEKTVLTAWRFSPSTWKNE